jgi:hypothetical protein
VTILRSLSVLSECGGVTSLSRHLLLNVSVRNVGGCLVILVTKGDRWESTSQGRVMCEHYLSVLMYTPVMFDFTTEDIYWIEQENR